MPYRGKLPEDAGSADEHLHLLASKDHVEREDARKAAAKVRWAKEDGERAKAAAELRASRQRERDNELRQELRGRFFAANPAAAESDFSRLLPSMRDEALLERTRRRADEEVESLRARTPGL